MTQAPKVDSGLDDHSVLSYLKADSGFFSRHPAFLAELALPNPHGEGVISLSTKQVELLRTQLQEKSKLLDALIEFGKTNDAIHAKIHQLSLQLMQATNMHELHAVLKTHIQAAFDLSHASLHLLDDNESEQSNVFVDWVKTQTKPYCNVANEAIESLISSNYLSSNHASFSVTPIIDDNQVVGCILLASTDDQHFSASMETDFLSRIGELFYARLTALDKA